MNESATVPHDKINPSLYYRRNVSFDASVLFADTVRASADKHEQLNTSETKETHVTETSRVLGTYVYNQKHPSQECQMSKTVLNDLEPITDSLAINENVKSGSIITGFVNKAQNMPSEAIMQNPTASKSQQNARPEISVFK